MARNDRRAIFHRLGGHRCDEICPDHSARIAGVIAGSLNHRRAAVAAIDDDRLQVNRAR